MGILDLGQFRNKKPTPDLAVLIANAEPPFNPIDAALAFLLSKHCEGSVLVLTSEYLAEYIGMREKDFDLGVGMLPDGSGMAVALVLRATPEEPS